MSPTTWKIALPLPLPQLFDYLPVPGAPARAGARVRVPLGKRELVGVLIAQGVAGTDAAALKPALALLDQEPLLEGELLQSLQWLARYLHAPLGEVLATALPAALRRGEPVADIREHGWRLTEAGATALQGMREGRPRTLAQRLRSGPLADADLHGEARAALRSLLKRELVAACTLEPDDGAAAMDSGPSPNPEQAEAIASVLAEATHFAPSLLEGVTGSGKTEVYLRLIADCLARGRQALVLVPEIGLTPQMLARFRRRLGVPVHALHSGLNDGERARVWELARRGRARVVVGTRSAVFTPLPDAGLIVVDEEHDGSYKQLDGIRYHARDFAIVRARALEVPVVLGSATPSLESLHNAQAGRYAHLSLRRRAGDAQPPRVRVLDVRKRALHGGLSEEALAAIGQVLEQGGQVLVFRNRRGYAPVLLCHDCGWSAHCPRCSTPERGTPMTVHAHGRRLQCHHCGLRNPAPPACPDCGGLALQPQGNGTERIEEELVRRFGEHWPVLRIDRGSTAGRDALQRHLQRLGAGPGILVGTQMLAKGHDLPQLVLVVVVGIDEGLHSADFRSGEKLAQLLIQVAGRAGRAQHPGEVLLQTHHPEHALLQTLLHGGYPAFAELELELRSATGFPPFAHLVMVRAEARETAPAGDLLQDIAALVRDAAAAVAGGGEGVQVHGPMPAPMPRRAGYQRQQLVIAADERPLLQRVLGLTMPRVYTLPAARKLRWSLDVDPVDLY